MLQGGSNAAEQRPGAALTVAGVSCSLPGASAPLLQDASLHLPALSLGLIYGRSGSGKTTLLQVIAGLLQESAGSVHIASAGDAAAPPPPAGLADRQRRVGLVFQFPERHFLTATVQSELVFGWPRTPVERGELAARVPGVLRDVGLATTPLHTRCTALSDGYKRRLALAVQLVRQPEVVLLDEPLAGLDLAARGEVVEVLQRLKSRCTVLVVSHDLREMSPLVDHAWCMEPGGTLVGSRWPLEEARQPLTWPPRDWDAAARLP